MHLAALLAGVRVVGLGDHLRLAAQPYARDVVAEDGEPDREVGRDVRPNRWDLLDPQRDVERVLLTQRPFEGTRSPVNRAAATMSASGGARDLSVALPSDPSARPVGVSTRWLCVGNENLA